MGRILRSQVERISSKDVREDISVQPRPAILVADCRTGGTFLSGCLSNHPEIFWTRGEPMSPRFRLVKDKVERLRFIHAQQFYEVAGCKIMVGQFDDALLRYLKGLQDLKVLYIERENVLDQAISWEANVITPFAHNWQGHEPERRKVILTREGVRKRIDFIRARRRRSQEILIGLGVEHMSVTYEVVTGSQDVSGVPAEAADLICEYLQVKHCPLYTTQRKLTQVEVVNREELYDVLRNS